MLKIFFALLALSAISAVAFLGLRGQTCPLPPIEIFSDMVRQPKVKAGVPSAFFADGRAARRPVEGTMPMGYTAPLNKPVQGGEAGGGTHIVAVFSSGTRFFETGKSGAVWGKGFPVEVTPELVARGRERFSIHCAVCHGDEGNGRGVAWQYGLTTVADLHQERILSMPEGEIFGTITSGKNTMAGAGDRISLNDRWAIIAYLRSLQLGRTNRNVSQQVQPQ